MIELLEKDLKIERYFNKIAKKFDSIQIDEKS